MSDNSKINICINSKNRRSDEPTSNFNVIIPDGLLKVTKNEEFELNVIHLMVSIAFIIVIIIVINFNLFLEKI
jgi:hypothetical protein